MFADGACEGKSRSEEEAMQGHRRRRATQRSPATSISPKGGGGTAAISLSLLLHDVTDIASSSLRELDAVALATNVTVFMERGTKRIFSAPLYEATIWSLVAPGWTRTKSRSIPAFSRISTSSLSYRISHTPFTARADLSPKIEVPMRSRVAPSSMAIR